MVEQPSDADGDGAGECSLLVKLCSFPGSIRPRSHLPTHGEGTSRSPMNVNRRT